MLEFLIIVTLCLRTILLRIYLISLDTGIKFYLFDQINRFLNQNGFREVHWQLPHHLSQRQRQLLLHLVLDYLIVHMSYVFVQSIVGYVYILSPQERYDIYPHSQDR